MLDTWPAAIPTVPTRSRATPPSASAPDGALYLMAITGDDAVEDSEFLSPAGGPGRIVMSRSTDDGETWSPVSIVVNDGVAQLRK